MKFSNPISGVRSRSALALVGCATVLGVSAVASAADDTLKISGYTDLSYSHFDGTTSFTSGIPARVFDIQKNGGRWNQTAFTISDLPTKGFGIFLNVTAGSDAQAIQSYGYNGGLFDLTQAYIQYSTGALSLDLGKYTTLAGSEVIASTGNTNYSRSILFGYAVPFTHTGVRATYAPSAKASYTLGVNNGWDDIADTNESKTLEAGINYMVSKKLTIAAAAYLGKERVFPGTSVGDEGDRSLLDLIATYTISDKSSIVINADFGQQKNASNITVDGNDTAKWTGVAAYYNRTLNDKLHFTLRGEYFDDANGYKTGIIQKWKEVTLTLGYNLSPNSEIRVEGRTDNSDSPVFLSNTGGTKKSLTSYAIQYIVKF